MLSFRSGRYGTFECGDAVCYMVTPADNQIVMLFGKVSFQRWKLTSTFLDNQLPNVHAALRTSPGLPIVHSD